MNLQQVAVWFTTGGGRLLAGLTLVVLVYCVRFFPGVGARLKEGWRQRVLAAVLALAPAVALDLVTDVPLRELLVTAVVSFLTATGWHHLFVDMLPELGSRKEATLESAMQAVILVILRTAAAEAAKAGLDTSKLDLPKLATLIQTTVMGHLRNPGSGDAGTAGAETPQTEPAPAPVPSPEPPPENAS